MSTSITFQKPTTTCFTSSNILLQTRQRYLIFMENLNALNKIDYYLDGLDTALKGVTKGINIYWWILSKQSLERVFKASCNSSRLIIRYSKLDWDNDFDFSGPEYNTTYLSFSKWGNNHGNNWSVNPEKLERIIKAISLCSMKDSLQTLNVRECGVTIRKVEKMLSANEMDNVQLCKFLNNKSKIISVI